MGAPWTPCSLPRPANWPNLSKGSETPTGPVSACWRAPRPLAGPVCSLLRAGLTRTLPQAWQGRLATSDRLGEAPAHWHAQPSFHCGMSTSLSCREGSTTLPGQASQFGRLFAASPCPACSSRQASGMEPSSTPATQPGRFKQPWRSSRPMAHPVCSLTWAGPIRTLPPAWQRRQGDCRKLVELTPIGAPVRSLARDGPAPHPTASTAP